MRRKPDSHLLEILKATTGWLHGWHSEFCWHRMTCGPRYEYRLQERWPQQWQHIMGASTLLIRSKNMAVEFQRKTHGVTVVARFCATSHGFLASSRGWPPRLSVKITVLLVWNGWRGSLRYVIGLVLTLSAFFYCQDTELDLKRYLTNRREIVSNALKAHGLDSAGFIMQTLQDHSAQCSQRHPSRVMFSAT